jgi:hypothetical protein
MKLSFDPAADYRPATRNLVILGVDARHVGVQDIMQGLVSGNSLFACSQNYSELPVISSRFPEFDVYIARVDDLFGARISALGPALGKFLESFDTAHAVYWMGEGSSGGPGVEIIKLHGELEELYRS